MNIRKYCLRRYVRYPYNINCSANAWVQWDASHFGGVFQTPPDGVSQTCNVWTEFSGTREDFSLYEFPWRTLPRRTAGELTKEPGARRTSPRDSVGREKIRRALVGTRFPSEPLIVVRTLLSFIFLMCFSNFSLLRFSSYPVSSFRFSSIFSHCSMFPTFSHAFAFV